MGSQCKNGDCTELKTKDSSNKMVNLKIVIGYIYVTWKNTSLAEHKCCIGVIVREEIE